MALSGAFLCVTVPTSFWQYIGLFPHPLRGHIEEFFRFSDVSSLQRVRSRWSSSNPLEIRIQGSSIREVSHLEIKGDGFAIFAPPDNERQLIARALVLGDALEYHALFHVSLKDGCEMNGNCAAWILHARPRLRWLSRTWSGDKFLLSRQPLTDSGGSPKSTFVLTQFSCASGDDCTSIEQETVATYEGQGPGDQLVVYVKLAHLHYYIRVDCADCDVARSMTGFDTRLSGGSIGFLGLRDAKFDIIDLKLAEVTPAFPHPLFPLF